MTVRTILEYPDPRLQQSAEPVADFDGRLASLVEDLFDTLYATGGIGLCAPQIGEPSRVLVMDLSPDRSAPVAFVNPEILESAVPGLVEESCLSVPGVVANVLRSTQLRARARNERGEFFERALEGMEAVCLQHEMDHLAGKLFIDRLPLLRRLRARAAAGAYARRKRSRAA